MKTTDTQKHQTTIDRNVFSTFYATCSCGWKSRICGTDLAAYLEAAQHRSPEAKQ